MIHVVVGVVGYDVVVSARTLYQKARVNGRRMTREVCIFLHDGRQKQVLVPRRLVLVFVLKILRVDEKCRFHALVPEGFQDLLRSLICRSQKTKLSLIKIGQ